MRRDYLLTAGNPGFSTTIDFESAAIVVANPTSSPVYLRLGSIDQPSAVDAQVIVPAATAQSYPTSGRMFAGIFGSPSLVASGAAALSGLFSTATVSLLDGSESIPSYGAYSFLSLSVSELLPPTSWAGGTTSPTVDLGAWGGALISLFPSPGTGQGIVSVQASADRISWQVLNSWAFWPSSPVAIQVPRTLRYLRIGLGSAGIAGDPAIGGSFAIRATMTELAQLTYSQAGIGVTKTLAVPHLGTLSTIVATVGLPAVAIRWQPATATGSAGQVVWYTAANPGGPWALVAYREQQMAGSLASLYRSVGSLDKYLRVDVLDTDVAPGGFTGDLTLTTLPLADQTQYLQAILAALGDAGMATPNVNQDLYHAVLTMLGDTAHLSAVEANTYNTHVDTAGIKADTAHLPTIDISTATTHADLVSIKADTAHLTNIETNTFNTHVDLVGIQASVSSLQAHPIRGTNPVHALASGYNTTGALRVMTPVYGGLFDGQYLQSVKLSYVLSWGTGSAIMRLRLYLGTATVPGAPVFWGFVSALLDPHGTFTYGESDRKRFDGPRSGGLLISGGQTTFWVMAESGGIDATHTMEITLDAQVSN